MAIYRLGFVMEQTLGHVTHDRNLRHWASCDSDLAGEWMPVEFARPDIWQRIPPFRSNWTLRASVRALRMAKSALHRKRLDGLFFHTQVTALLATGLMRQVPTIVSLDATPLNVDTVGAAYEHQPSRLGALERFKNRLNRKTFVRARHLITWCDWAKQSLVNDYGIPAAKVTVIPPGVDMGRWHFDRPPHPKPGAARLLFVGGDFRRKGGELLLKAYRERLCGKCELDIVTREPVNTDGLQGVRVHHGLIANSPELMALYENADIFVFPTQGDCLPIAVMEAMAAELPVVAASVGALCEEVDDGVTGYLIAPGDAESLAARTLQLAEDADLRWRMGRAGRQKAEQKFDGARNYQAVIALYKRCVDGRPAQ